MAYVIPSMSARASDTIRFASTFFPSDPTLFSSLPRARGLSFQLSQLIGTYITVSIHFIVYAGNV
jgi:hypothetical protein